MDIAFAYVACLLLTLLILSLTFAMLGAIRFPRIDRRLRRPALIALAGCAAIVALVWFWPVRLAGGQVSTSRLDALLPRYHLRETHSIRIHAPPHAIEWGILATDANDLRGFGAAMWIQCRVDQVRAVLHGATVPEFQMAWRVWDRNREQCFVIDTLLDYCPEGPMSTERWVRAPGGVMLELPPPYIHDGYEPPTGDRPAPTGDDSTCVVGRRIIDQLANDYDHACAVLIMRNDTLATFRIGPRTGREIWVEVRMEPGGNAYDIRKLWCDGADPERDWSVLSWLQFYGYDRLAYEQRSEFVMGQLRRVGPQGDRWRRPVASDAARFSAFNESGCAKTALSFRIHALGKEWYRLDIERRALAHDARTATAYARPWRLSRPMRDVFFELWLRRIKGYAEHWNSNCGANGLRDVALPDTLGDSTSRRTSIHILSWVPGRSYGEPFRDRPLKGKDVGEVKRAKDDGRLPMEDHNTRLIVIGGNAAEARYVAETLSREAFHDVAYFRGNFPEAQAILRPLATPPDSSRTSESCGQPPTSTDFMTVPDARPG